MSEVKNNTMKNELSNEEVTEKFVSMAFDMTNILKETLQTQKGTTTIFGEAHAAHHCAKLAFETINPLQTELTSLKKHIKDLQDTETNMREIIESQNEQVTSLKNQVETMREALEDAAVKSVINECKETVTLYRAGRESLLGALIGQAMIYTRGHANPKTLTDKFRLSLQKGENDNG